jgi:hypothetical protein
MTLGKGHLMARLPIFAAALVYNLWYFTRGEDVAGPGAQPEPAPVAAIAGPSVTGETAMAPGEPAQIQAPPEVALDRLPQWGRNPFASAQPPRPVQAAVVEAAAPEPEIDIVINAIFVSGDRRRARVNGETVTVGDRIGGSAIVEIQPNAIVVESPAAGRRTITQRRAGVGH